MVNIKELLSARKELIPFLPAGYPSLESTKKLVKALVEEGIKIIEIGVPFSDPVADGPIIATSYEYAIRNGVKSKDVYDLADQLARAYNIAIIPMLYYNLIYNIGEENFAKRISSFAQAVIVPDLPLKESHRVMPYFDKYNISYIPFATPNIKDVDIKRLSKLNTPFIYAVTVLGITGERLDYSAETYDYLNRLKTMSFQNVAAGFGVSTREQFDKLPANAVIVGSAIVKKIDPKDDEKSVSQVRAFIKSLLGKNVSQET